MADYDAETDALRKAVMIGVEQHRRGEYTAINSEAELDAYFENLKNEVDAELAQKH